MRNIVCILFLTALTGGGFAQSKTITNSDLEKFRQKRLAGEKQLRENYREMGFPSPEELAKQNEADSRALAERSLRYRRLQNERARQRAENANQSFVYYYPQTRGTSYSRYYLGSTLRSFYYPGRSGTWFRNGKRNRSRRGPGFISNPIIRGNWLRQSAPMRRTYRSNRPATRVRRQF